MLTDKKLILEMLANHEFVNWSDTPYVGCDEPCFALENPQTLEEYQAAHDHWKNHGWLSGCSHAD
jgi:hypothetical protein